MNDETKEKLGLLIADIVNGRISAIDDIYGIMGKVMLSIAYLYFNNKEDAEDCVHDAFVTIVRKAAKFTSNKNAYAWINTITKRVALNKIKKTRRRNEIGINKALGANGIDIEDHLLIKEILNMLNSKERDAIIYKYWYGLSLTEIGLIIKKSKTSTFYFIKAIEEKVKFQYKQIIY